MYSLFTKQHVFRLVKIESICRRQNECDSEIEICSGKGRKHCGKRIKSWLPTFSRFPSCFQKAKFYFRVDKSGDCVVKS